jgi:hypothetical protein
MAAADQPAKPTELGAPLCAEACAATLQLPVKPSPVVLEGFSLRLEPYDEAAHAPQLYAVSCGAAALGHPRYDADALLWRYLLSAGLLPAPVPRWMARTRDCRPPSSSCTSARAQMRRTGGHG